MTELYLVNNSKCSLTKFPLLGETIRYLSQDLKWYILCIHTCDLSLICASTKILMRERWKHMSIIFYKQIEE